MVNLNIEIAGIRFKNPVLNAACPISRDAEAMKELVDGGAGGIVAKTFSVKPAEVPRPNMGVVDRGVIRGQVLTYTVGGTAVTKVAQVRSYYAFLNAELWSDLPPDQWLKKELREIRKYTKEKGIPLLASIGYKPEELSSLGPKVQEVGVDGIEFSTHYIGQDYRPIVEAAKALRESVDVPIFAKLSPFTPNIPELVKELEKVGVDGVVATNTIGPALHIDVETGKPIMGGPYGYGWLSGPALKPLALAVVAQIAQNTKLPIIGVGGITKGTDIIEYYMVGASAVQVCTIVILEGPKVFSRLVKEVKDWLKNHGYDSPLDIKGIALKYIKPEALRVRALPPIVDVDKCIACGLCESSCVYDAVHVVKINGKKAAQVNSLKCYGCGLCTTLCPTRAIYFEV